MGRRSRFRSTLAGLALAGMSAMAEAENLYELYSLALDNNPALKQRESEVEQATAQKDLALSGLLPHLSANLTTSPSIRYKERNTGAEQNYDGSRRSIQLSQALFDLSSWYRLESERGHVLQANVMVEAARMMMAGDLLDRYLTVLQAEDESARIDAEKQAVAAQVKRLRQMRERQMTKVTDVYAAEAYFQRLETEAIEAQAARSIALERLREICGSLVTGIPGLSRMDLSADARGEAQWIDHAVARNPILVSLRHAIEANRSLVASGRAQHAPVLSLAASRVYSDQGYDNHLQPPYSVDSVSVQLNIPIYEGGRVDATVRDAVARRHISEQQYEEARREVVRQVRTDFLHAKASQARIESTGREVKAQEQLVDAQEKGYRLGATTIVDVLDARRQLFKVRAEQSKARYDLVRDLTSLRVRAGELDATAVQQVSSWFGVPSSPTW